MNTYMLTVTYKAKTGCGKKFVQELEQSGIADTVRAEDGCICYNYYFSATDEDTVLLFEEWESKHHQQVHMTQPHIAPLMKIKENYILDTKLRVL